jgi:CubicO group peptidase (beta-lactamase class C family)
MSLDSRVDAVRVAERQSGSGARPTINDWLKAPGNVWAFRHARELFRSERVRAGRGVPLPLAADTHPVNPALADYLQRSDTDALLVLSDGELTTEWYAPGVRPDDRHMIFSCTKSVVGLVAEAMVAEGSLDEKAPVTDYIPEVAQGGYAGATVRDVLDMTANVVYTEDYDGPDVRAFRIACGQIESPDSQGIHAYTAALPAAGEHGRATRYASPTTDLAGWLCERVAVQSLADLISTYVWEPMGAEFEGDLLLDRFGGARASGGFCVAPRDMARIGQLLFREDLTGPLAAAVAAVKQAGDAQVWAAGNLADFIPGGAYRSFWYQIPNDPEIYLAAGIYGQRIYVDVPRRVVIAQQSSLPDSFDSPTWGETLPIFRQIAHSVAGH